MSSWPARSDGDIVADGAAAQASARVRPVVAGDVPVEGGVEVRVEGVAVGLVGRRAFGVSRRAAGWRGGG